ncbi:hypothetical protein F5884DRAFT_828154 [Xylogone sp. PMI_703]|nr:hypothetical protein F5884DRAFT_828154 [Xylogone sp. PMI_703]
MFHRLDFSDFYSTNPATRVELCNALVSSLKQHGFVRLINHGVPPPDIDTAFETSKHFFQLPFEQKMKSPHPPTANPHRGFTAVGIENVAAVSNFGSAVALPFLKDMKESYDIGSERDELYQNIWPPAGVHNTFQPTFTSFFSMCYRVELSILEAISIGLKFPTQALSQLHASQANELRLTHYPAVSRGEFAHSTRIAAHTDFGTITLLFQDNVGGLQVEYPQGSGKFVDIESGGPYECILNVGDCLQKWTGLPSARHRVHMPEQLLEESKGNPKTKDTIEERFSIAYFAKPDRSSILRPLQAAGEVEYNQSTKYLTAGEFQHMRIQGTYA